MEAGREEIARAEAAAVLTVGKSCGQHRNLGSPKSSARTALEDLREIPVEAITDDRHHRALDKVAAQKDRLRTTSWSATGNRLACASPFSKRKDICIRAHSVALLATVLHL